MFPVFQVTNSKFPRVHDNSIVEGQVDETAIWIRWELFPVRNYVFSNKSRSTKGKRGRSGLAESLNDVLGRRFSCSTGQGIGHPHVSRRAKVRLPVSREVAELG